MSRTVPPDGPDPVPVVHHHHPHWQTRLRNLLIAGLFILAPVYLTFYVLVLLFRFMDGIFAPLIDRTLATFLERSIHIPGLGIILTLTVVLFLGWLSRQVVGRRILDSVESLIRRIPIAKSVYGATKGVLDAVSRDQADAFKRVVLVEFPRKGIYAIGFITGTAARWSEGDPRLDEDLIPVFIPKTPNPTGGFLLLVPPREILECTLTVEEGIRMIVSGGILQPQAVPRQTPEPSPPQPSSPDPSLPPSPGEEGEEKEERAVVGASFPLSR